MFLSLLGDVWAQSQPVPRVAKAKHATVELISDGGLPAPGGSMWLGLRFRLEPGWHIYWLNPGDSGQPPSVRWQVPSGITVGSLEWPVPERIVLDPLVNYGYKDEVVLPARLTFSAAWTGGRLPIRASVRWLICHDVCIPDRAELQLSLPLPAGERGEASGWGGLITSARNRLPQPAPPGWKAAAQSHEDLFSISLHMDREAPERAVFFPLETGQIDDSAPQGVEKSKHLLKLSLRKSDQLTSVPAKLKGVLAFPSGEAFVVNADVHGGKPAQSIERSKR